MTKAVAVTSLLDRVFKEDPQFVNNPTLVNDVAEKIEHVHNIYTAAIEKHGAVEALYPLLKQMDGMTAEGNKKVTVTCKKGCWYCCHMQVSITKEEAALIVYACEQHGIAIDKEHLKKQLGMDQNAHCRSEHSACVFLKDKLCSIYDVRPTACRKYFVGTPVELCKIGQSGQPMQQVGILSNIDVEILASAIMDNTQGTMAEMLLNELENRGL